MRTKTCPRCEETKVLTEFPRNKRCPDGHKTICQWCVDAAKPTKHQAPKHRVKIIERAVNRGGHDKPDACEMCSAEAPLRARYVSGLTTVQVQWVCRPCYKALKPKKGEPHR